jgi:hypothetical protein
MSTIAVDVGTGNSAFPKLAAGDARAWMGDGHVVWEGELVAVALAGVAVGVGLVATPEHPARVTARITLVGSSRLTQLYNARRSNQFQRLG